MRASVVVVPGFSYPAACEIFRDQGSNLSLLLWQADSLPWSQQGSPDLGFPHYSTSESLAAGVG